MKLFHTRSFQKPPATARGAGLPVILLLLGGAVILALVIGFATTSRVKTETELARLREESAELQKLRVEVVTLRQRPAEKAAETRELTGNERAELQRLRAELPQRREEKKQLDQFRAENVQLRAQAQQAQMETQQIRQQAAQGAAMAQAQSAAISMRNACIANLKQIDGATQQWALENRLTASSRVDGRGILAYLKGMKLPVCPAGGVYQFSTVSAVPTCTVPGHSL